MKYGPHLFSNPYNIKVNNSFNLFKKIFAKCLLRAKYYTRFYNCQCDLFILERIIIWEEQGESRAQMNIMKLHWKMVFMGKGGTKDNISKYSGILQFHLNIRNNPVYQMFPSSLHT